MIVTLKGEQFSILLSKALAGEEFCFIKQFLTCQVICFKTKFPFHFLTRNFAFYLTSQSGLHMFVIILFERLIIFFPP